VLQPTASELIKQEIFSDESEDEDLGIFLKYIFTSYVHLKLIF
jgi:hypothetical protein